MIELKVCAALLVITTSPLLAQNTNLPVVLKEPPTYYAQYNNVNTFINANAATPDVFNKSANKLTVGVPENYMGNQAAVEGDTYFGIVAYYNEGQFPINQFFDDWEAAVNNLLENDIYAEEPGYTMFSEYVQLPISMTLRAGAEYMVKFKVSLADKSAYAVSGLGAVITAEPVNEKTNARLNIENQVSSSDVIQEKKDWVEVSGKFIAKGDEKYITIGCFNKNFKAEKIVAYNQMNNRKAYYYISAINISEAGGINISR